MIMFLIARRSIRFAIGVKMAVDVLAMLAGVYAARVRRAKTAAR